MSEQLSYIECSKITPNRFQPRKEFKVKELEELAESIDNQGLIQPITVRKITDVEDFEYELIAGERRLRATRDVLGKDKIRAIVKEMSDEASQEAAITENLQRQDLNPIEEANAIIQLMDMHSLTQEQVAKRIGKSRSYIANVIRLVRLNKDVIAHVSSGAIDRSKALALLAITDEKTQSKLAKASVAKNWTVEKLKAEVEKIIAEQDPNKEKKLVKRNIDGQNVIVATPSKAHRRKIKPKLENQHFVLIELDTEETVKDFVQYMADQEWKCWVGDEAFEQMRSLEKVALEKPKTNKEPLEAFEGDDE